MATEYYKNMSISAYESVIDKLREHLESFNRLQNSYFIKIREYRNYIYFIEINVISVGELTFNTDSLTIDNDVAFLSAGTCLPIENIVDEFNYYDQNSFNLTEIKKIVNAIILIALYKNANASLKILLENDRFLAVMTTIIDINNAPISRDVFDKFRKHIYKEIYAPNDTIHCLHIINDYFKINKLIIDNCKDYLSVIYVTYPCLELGVPVKAYNFY